MEFDYEFDENGLGIEDYPAMGGTGTPPEPSGPRWLRAMLGDDMFCHVKIAHLAYRDVTATDLPNFEHLPGLEVLDLSHNTIDDSHLASLYNLTDLRELYLGNTRVTDAGVKKLQQALPNCKIIR